MLFPLFFILYGLSSAFIVPSLSSRIRLSSTNISLKPIHKAFHWCNRTYVTKDAYETLQKFEQLLKSSSPNTPVYYMDAGFPFSFTPMFPHLSHGDGRKIDIALQWQDVRHHLLTSAPSPIGYFIYDGPKSFEPSPCSSYKKLSMRWNMTWLQKYRKNFHHTHSHINSILIECFLKAGAKKILLEPHLKKRWGINHKRVKFQGCRAARHDDHMHVVF
jgi:hypothetical protein